MSEQSPNMVALMEHAAKALVENQAEVLVESFDEDGEIVLELTVAEDDMGRIIGRQGRTARALRHLLRAAGAKTNRRYELEILE
ncbi:MAG: KH domain-containing protein [Terriglobales bacterium]|jgi:predicted RNA-binding protein YlqC (UPF0109 family)